MKCIYLEEDRLLATKSNSMDEYITEIITQEQHQAMMDASFFNESSWLGVSSYEELTQKMLCDEHEVHAYKKLKASCTHVFAKSKTSYVKQYRDSGMFFNHTRYLDGRENCVWKKKPTTDCGSTNNKLISIFVGTGGACSVDVSELRYQMVAVLELVKALQALGKDVEIHTVNFYRGGLEIVDEHESLSLMEVITIKKGTEATVIPALIAGLSPSFFRCFKVKARCSTHAPKDWSELTKEQLKFDEGMGRADRIKDYCDEIKPHYKRALERLGLYNPNAIFIDTNEVKCERTLKNFRTKHNLIIKN
jgi:hypothetical protein